MDEEEVLQKTLHMAMILLSRQNLSREELRYRLLKKGAAEELLEAVLGICMERGYVDDKERASQIIRKGLRSGHGPLRIQRDLQRCGIPLDMAQTLLDTAMDAEGSGQLAAAAEGKLARMREADPAKRRAALYRFLLSRGFSSSQITDFLYSLPRDL